LWFHAYLELHSLDYTHEHFEALRVNRGLIASRTMVDSMYKALGITRKKVPRSVPLRARAGA
jgi:hypothetical protein